MKTNAKQVTPTQKEAERHLSPWRVALAICMLIAIGAGSFYAMRWWQQRKTITIHEKPWFAAYVDVTATPTFAFENMGATTARDAVLSFIVSLPSNTCTPAWGSAYTLDQASASLDLDRRIARLQQQGGSVAISFGGLKNEELAVGCSDPTKLLTAYQTVVSRYNVDTIDLDLEGNALTDTVAGTRRATAIAELQTARRKQGKHLAVWITVPVAPDGLTEDGTNAIALLLSKGVDIAGVNVMTMDYGSSLTSSQTMLTASETALTQTQRQLGILYRRASINLTDKTLWSKLGATPMIGQNDLSDEVFTLAEAGSFNQFAQNHGVGRMSMWSANRDITCGSNYVDLRIVSDSCSGVLEDKQNFSSLLSAGFDGSITLSAGIITKSDATHTTETPDDPATSPYQIWADTNAYIEGTKVVWHHNVYEAKWWTQGDVPDNPVLQAWQTPWQLIGPVLPGEKPIPQATLPAGTYPTWQGTTAYTEGQRVLFNGVPYQAKWWNQGNSPAASNSNPDASPWAPLTQAQINAIVTPR